MNKKELKEWYEKRDKIVRDLNEGTLYSKMLKNEVDDIKKEKKEVNVNLNAARDSFAEYIKTQDIKGTIEQWRKESEELSKPKIIRWLRRIMRKIRLIK